MGKLSEREKLERLPARTWAKETQDPETEADIASRTQQINREDPQAGYDRQLPDTQLNGKVSRNPKDGREGNA